MRTCRSYAVLALVAVTGDLACCEPPLPPPQCPTVVASPPEPPPPEIAEPCDPSAIPAFSWADEVISRNDAARILREAENDPEKAEQLARMREIFYIADLSWASGSEDSAERLIRRVEQEFANPHYVTAEGVEATLAEMRRIADEYPPPPPSGDPEAAYYGWNKAKAVLDPLLGLVPSRGEAFDELLGFPPDLLVPFLLREYYDGDFYHEYNLRNRLFEVLATGGFGYAVMDLVESRLKDGDPSEGPGNIYGIYWTEAVDTGSEILGEDFDDWYCSVRGSSFADDRRLNARRAH